MGNSNCCSRKADYASTHPDEFLYASRLNPSEEVIHALQAAKGLELNLFSSNRRVQETTSMTPAKSSIIRSPSLIENFSDYQRKGTRETPLLNDLSPHSRYALSKPFISEDDLDSGLYHPGMESRKRCFTEQVQSKNITLNQETVIQGQFTNMTMPGNRWDHDDVEEEIVMFEGVTFPATEVDKTYEENITTNRENISTYREHI